MQVSSPAVNACKCRVDSSLASRPKRLREAFDVDVRGDMYMRPWLSLSGCRDKRLVTRLFHVFAGWRFHASLAKYRLSDMSVNVGQAEATSLVAISQAFMIDAQQV